MSTLTCKQVIIRCYILIMEKSLSYNYYIQKIKLIQVIYRNALNDWGKGEIDYTYSRYNC